MTREERRAYRDEVTARLRDVARVEARRLPRTGRADLVLLVTAHWRRAVQHAKGLEGLTIEQRDERLAALAEALDAVLGEVQRRWEAAGRGGDWSTRPPEEQE